MKRVIKILKIVFGVLVLLSVVQTLPVAAALILLSNSSNQYNIGYVLGYSVTTLVTLALGCWLLYSAFKKKIEKKVETEEGILG